MASKGTGYFSKEFFDFMSDLKAHNDKAWFQANKGRYEASVQEPAVRFIADAVPELRKISPHVTGVPKAFGGSLTRIYRDTRFSKDKSPYHTYIGIHFSHDQGGKNEPGLPGFYFHADAKEAGVFCGVWHPEGPALKAIRDAIVGDPNGWKKAKRGVTGMYGESLKRPPPGYDPAHPLIEDLKRKDFVGSVTMTRAEIASPQFMKNFVGAARKLDDMNAFIAKAIGVPW